MSTGGVGGAAGEHGRLVSDDDVRCDGDNFSRMMIRTTMMVTVTKALMASSCKDDDDLEKTLMTMVAMAATKVTT